MMNAITLDLSPVIKLTDEQYYKLATAHPNLRMERTPTGELVIMPPTGGETGRRNSDITTQLGIWVRQNPELGVAFDSSTEFKLPGNGDRSPDAAWVKMERWVALTQEEREKFPPICPDFVIELRCRRHALRASPSDRLTELQAKMQEYQGQWSAPRLAD